MQRTVALTHGLHHTVVIYFWRLMYLMAPSPRSPSQIRSWCWLFARLRWRPPSSRYWRSPGLEIPTAETFFDRRACPRCPLHLLAGDVRSISYYMLRVTAFVWARSVQALSQKMGPSSAVGSQGGPAGLPWVDRPPPARSNV